MSRAQQRRNRNRGPPCLPPPPPPPPTTTTPPEPEQPQPAPVFFGPHIARGRRSQAYSRECKLKTVLRVPEFRNIIRTFAEENTRLRIDGTDLAHLVVHSYFSLPEVERGAFPDVLDPSFWSYCYRHADPNYHRAIPANHPWGQQIIDARNNLLNPSRQVPRTNRFLYDIPPVQGYLSVAAIKYGEDMTKTKASANLILHGQIDVNAHRAFYARRCDEADLFVRDQLTVFSEERITEHYERIIRFSHYLLDLHSYLYGAQLWSLLPLAKNTIAYVPLLESRMLYYLLRHGWERGIQYHGRLAELFPVNEGVKGIVGVAAFDTLSADKNVDYKKLAWDYLFDIQGKFGVNNYVCFDNGAATDGDFISFHFRRLPRGRNAINTNYNEMKFMPRNQDISNWDHSLVLLNKNPVSLDPNENYRTIGNDPGVRSVLTCVATTENLEIKVNRLRFTYSISNAEYQQRSGVVYHTVVELQARAATNMEPLYNTLRTPKVTSLEGFQIYLNNACQSRRRMLEFNFSFRHRERKNQLKSQRGIAKQSLVEDVRTLGMYEAHNEQRRNSECG